jgi:tRNA(Ile)-lysidine synthase TilS/MesJ
MVKTFVSNKNIDVILNVNMTLQRLMSYIRRACDEYEMIDAQDTVIAAISGGKDSLAMLAGLAAMRRFYPKPYHLHAVTVDLGFKGFDTAALADWCASMDVPYTVLKTDIGMVVFDERKEKNPCSLCARMRKGALNTEAQRLGAKRVAYGHSKDDIIHTFFMSLFLEGRLHKIQPVTYLSRAGVYTIRPMMLAPEKEITAFAKKNKLPVIKSPCPVDGYTQRAEMKNLTNQLRRQYDHWDEKVFNAILRSKI